MSVKPESTLSHPPVGLCNVKSWSSPAGQSSRPLPLTFWTNWWDAHQAMMLASDQISKVTALPHANTALLEKVWERVLLNLHNNLCSEVAQILHRWVRGKRCCKLRCLHAKVLLLFFLLMCCYGFCVVPHPKVMVSFHRRLFHIVFIWQKCVVTLACYPKGPFQSNLVKLAESLSHSSCTASRVKFHIYFIFAPHPCRCIVDKSLLIIYKHTNVSKTESINNCLFGNDSLKYLKFQWSTDGLR